MKILKREHLILAVALLNFLLAVLIYPLMPDPMVGHWSLAGEADGYLPKFWGVFLFPLIAAGLYVVYRILPVIDPHQENLKKFRWAFDDFVIAMELFFVYLFALTILWNLGITFNFSQFIAPAVGVLFYVIGILVEESRQNWFIGIRTPWTLSDERVWDQVHRISGRLFRYCALLAFLGIILPDLAFYLILVPVVAVAVFAIVYSYYEYQRLRK